MFFAFETQAWALPPQAWGALGAVIGAGVAMLVSWLENRAASERLRDQLRHDSREREAARLNSLRERLLTGAASDLVIWSRALSQFANVDLPLDRHEAVLSEAGERMAQAQLAASLDTAKALVNAGRCFVTSSFELQASKAKIMQLKAQARAAEEVAISELVPRDARTRAFEKRQQLLSEAGRATKPHVELAMRRVLEFAEVLVPAQVAIRRELGFTIDETEFSRILEAAREEARVEVARFLEALTAIDS